MQSNIPEWKKNSRLGTGGWNQNAKVMSWGITVCYVGRDYKKILFSQGPIESC